MSLEIGKNLGPYLILEPLGTGGMGEVYRAHDDKLRRDVAIKLVPEAMATHPDRIARLRREARALASLNHPNVAVIHGLEEIDDVVFLVLEVVDGDTLDDWLRQGPLPTEEALRIAAQIAEGLEAAHDSGIIHRDLKPANIKIASNGRVKLLDFGLAKTTERLAGARAGGQTHSPTVTVADTAAGVLMGTVPYMSPEQARGQELDQRADIWSFGCVLYEMLTGVRVFGRETASDTLAAILEHEPDWTALPAGVPSVVRHQLRRCLQKDPSRRLRHIADARIDIEDSDSGGSDFTLSSTTARAASAGGGNPWLLAFSMAIVSAAGASLAVWFAISPTTGTVADVRFDIEYPPGTLLRHGTAAGIAISPDGSSVVFNADRRLWHRPMNQLLAAPIRGTDQAMAPSFSPDGQQLGFWADGELRRVAIDGGVAVSLGPVAERPFGVSWSDDGYVYVGQGSGGVLRISEDGTGAPERVVEMEPSEQAHGPRLLPGNEWLLLALARGADWDEARIVVQSLVTGERRELGIVGTDARYVPTGHLVYARHGDLFAVPFDVDRLEVLGGSVPVVPDVQQSTRDTNDRSIPLTGASQFAFSDAGSLAYLPEGARNAEFPLVFVDREGQVEVLSFPPGNLIFPRLSPDDRLVAVAATDEDESQIWIHDLEQEAHFQLTSNGNNFFPVWSPDSQWVYFDSDRGGDRDVWRVRADLSTGPELVQGGPGRQTPYSISDDGKSLLFFDPYDPQDIWIRALDEPDGARNVVASDRSAMLPWYAPAGRAFVFETVEADGSHVYVQSVSTRARKPVASGNARRPVWSRDGREIFYVTGSAWRAQMSVVSVSVGQEIELSAPTHLFDFQYADGVFTDTFDVTSDGQRFLMLGPNQRPGIAPAAGPRVVVVLDWFEELKRLAPTDG